MSLSVRVVSRVPQVVAEVAARAELITRKAAFEIEARAKSRAPVDTGALRNAINANGSGLEWQVDSPAEYSVFQEFGTRFMAAHPFLVPAIEEVRPVYLAALRSLAR